MTQASAPTDPSSQPPLLQQLASLGLLGSRIPANPGLAELLGNEIDLADSIALASTLASLDRARPLGNASLEPPQRQFLNARGGMLRLIASSFEPGDTPATAPQELHDDRQPIAVSYNPGVSALTVNFNVVEVSWARTPDTGELTGFALSRSDTLDVAAESIAFQAMPQPLSKKIPFLLDRAGAVAGQTNIAAQDSLVGERWLLSPTLPKEGEAVLPVKSPALNAAMIFRRLAADQGIALPLPEPAVAPAQGLRLLAEHGSVALDRVAALVLRYSNNLSAELVGLAATRVIGGPTDDLGRSGQALAGWLTQRIPWADWRGFVAANHSGLSSESRMTPRQAMAILQYAWGVRGEQFDLYALLAPVRWSDDLNEDRGEEETELAVRAKSGTLWYARALVGYMLTANGRTLGFALFVSDPAERAALDARMNVDELAEVPGARAWMKRAKELEKALVTRWAKGY